MAARRQNTNIRLTTRSISQAFQTQKQQHTQILAIHWCLWEHTAFSTRIHRDFLKGQACLSPKLPFKDILVSKHSSERADFGLYAEQPANQ